ncbi:hypothetical protein [Stappia sp.]|uniref:hypothetical protein n=1 Tax=Stappia sp. TaxID=1870903 RepID=UPI0032D914CA
MTRATLRYAFAILVALLVGQFLPFVEARLKEVPAGRFDVIPADRTCPHGWMTVDASNDRVFQDLWTTPEIALPETLSTLQYRLRSRNWTFDGAPLTDWTPPDPTRADGYFATGVPHRGAFFLSLLRLCAPRDHVTSAAS